MDFYLEISEKERVLVGEIPHESVDEITLSMTALESEIDGFMTLLGEKPLSPLPQSYNSICQILGLSGMQAVRAVPKERMRGHLEYCLRRIQKALCVKEDSEYLVTYLLVKRFLQRLSRSSVDLSKLIRMIDSTENSSVINSLKSFLPDDMGRCKKVFYSTTNTATGRLTVTSGPQILIVPGPARGCLESSYEKGRILQIDIISAEPKFALHLKGGNVPVDVYSYVSKNILKGEVQRKHTKLITLCALYGQSAKNLEKHLPEQVNAREVIRKTRQYFDYDYLISRLRGESRKGNFRNAVGRPIRIDNEDEHLLISYYLQSSVAEGSILMFDNFIQKFSNYCKPLFVIHDALIVDCQSEFAKSLLQKQRIKLYLADWEFDAEIKPAGDI